jgi:hypothetical protein
MKLSIASLATPRITVKADDAKDASAPTITHITFSSLYDALQALPLSEVLRIAADIQEAHYEAARPVQVAIEDVLVIRSIK